MHLLLKVVKSQKKNPSFKNLKKFSLLINHYASAFRQVTRNLHFDQLNELSLNTVREEFDPENFIEFIAMNRGLKTIETDVRLTTRTITAVLENLPELKEISVTLHPGMLHSFGAFFINHHGLNKINAANCYGVNIHDFQAIAPLNWQVVVKSSFTISFIRMD